MLLKTHSKKDKEDILQQIKIIQRDLSIKYRNILLAIFYCTNYYSNIANTNLSFENNFFNQSKCDGYNQVGNIAFNTYFGTIRL